MVPTPKFVKGDETKGLFFRLMDASKVREAILGATLMIERGEKTIKEIDVRMIILTKMVTNISELQRNIESIELSSSIERSDVST